MRQAILAWPFATAAFLLGRLSVQAVPGPAAAAEPARPLSTSCVGCQAEHVPGAEIERYVEVAKARSLTDQQVRSLDVGRLNLQIALAHRGPLSAPEPRSVAEHDLVTEVYVVLSGRGTHRTGPRLVDPVRRPPDHRSVRLLNGPGHNAADIEDAATTTLAAGDVVVIPAGTGHQFTRIDDHITYLMVRLDPDKVVPLLDAAASRRYLEQSR